MAIRVPEPPPLQRRHAPLFGALRGIVTGFLLLIGPIGLMPFLLGASYPELVEAYRANQLTGATHRLFAFLARVGLLEDGMFLVVRLVLLLVGAAAGALVVGWTRDAWRSLRVSMLAGIGVVLAWMVLSGLLFNIPIITTFLVGHSTGMEHSSAFVRQHVEGIAGLHPDVLIAVVLDTSQVSVDIEGVPPGSEGMTLSTVLAQNDVLAVIGGLFLESLDPPRPLGFYKLEGAMLNPILLRGPLSAVIASSGGRLLLLEREDVQVEQVKGGFQAGPWLVRDGSGGIAASEPQLRSPFTRGFIASCGGSVVFGAAVRPVNLLPVSQALLSSYRDKRPSCQEVVNLPGDGMELLAWRSESGWETRGDTDRKHLALIVARKR